METPAYLSDRYGEDVTPSEDESFSVRITPIELLFYKNMQGDWEGAVRSAFNIITSGSGEIEEVVHQTEEVAEKILRFGLEDLHNYSHDRDWHQYISTYLSGQDIANNVYACVEGSSRISEGVQASIGDEDVRIQVTDDSENLWFHASGCPASVKSSIQIDKDEDILLEFLENKVDLILDICGVGT